MELSKNKRRSRTRTELETDVFAAVRQLADEKGLAQISFTDIARRSGIQISVLKNNYKNIEQLLDKYTSVAGCWLRDIFEKEHLADTASEESFKRILKCLATYLYDNDNADIKRMLAWELEADTPATRRMARNCEKYYMEAIIPDDTIAECTGLSLEIIQKH